MDEMQSGFSVSNMSGFSGSNDYMESPEKIISGFKASLPLGFRFHPTDVELITHYLSRKINGESTFYIGEADLNKVEPWEIPDVCVGDREWFFFSLKDRKYSTGLRTNRATQSGYWKATGKDREIFKGKTIVGMKKTRVFYKGRAPEGERTDWVMHEYRSDDGKHSLPQTQNAKNEWVICKVFNKGSMRRKNDTSGTMAEDLSLEFMSQELKRPSMIHYPWLTHTLPDVEYDTTWADSIFVGVRPKQESNLIDKSGLCVKVEYNNDIVMFMLHFASMDSLKKEILKRYNKLEGESIKIRYKDEDEEMVTIACDEDLQYCLEIFKSTGRAPVRLFLFKEE